MRIHFISIGGAIMHNLAIALHLQGHHVSGSDDEIYEPARSQLAKYGLLPAEMGWDEQRIDSSLDAIILGMHARGNNPELVKAQALQLNIYSFPEYMYEHTKNKLRIVVGGSHGKTTTTSMILHVLRKQQISFDYLVGARLPGFETMVGLDASAQIAVFEGDEYLSSALDLRPKFHLYHADIALITGIAWDHMNVFPTWENYVSQFRYFVEQIPATGKIIYCQADANNRDLIAQSTIQAECIPYDTPDYIIENGQVLIREQGQLFPLKIFGQHNLQNLQAAAWACAECGISRITFLESIADFTGAAKRLEVLKETTESTIYRDFAHAPSKLQATTQAVRELHPHRTLIAIYELHTYSSLNQAFLPQYHHTLDQADIKMVYFSQHALAMKKLPPLDEQEVAAAFGADVQVFTDANALYQAIRKVYSGKEDLLLMSSGTFDQMPFDF